MNLGESKKPPPQREQDVPKRTMDDGRAAADQGEGRSTRELPMVWVCTWAVWREQELRGALFMEVDHKTEKLEQDPVR